MPRRLTALTSALIALAAAGPAVALPADGPSASIAAIRSVKLRDSYFSPSKITGTGKVTVRFTWAGTLAHNLVGRRIPSSYASARVRHKALTRTYGRGTYSFRCTIHPGMTFRLRVR